MQYLTPTLRGSGGSIVLWSVFSYHGLNLGNSHWKLVFLRECLYSLILSWFLPGSILGLDLLWSLLPVGHAQTTSTGSLQWGRPGAPSRMTEFLLLSLTNLWRKHVSLACICDLITTGKGRNQWIISFAYLSLPQQTLRYLKISTHPWPGVGIPSFPPENHGLRLGGTNSYSHSFTHACEYGLKLWS